MFDDFGGPGFDPFGGPFMHHHHHGPDFYGGPFGGPGPFGPGPGMPPPFGMPRPLPFGLFGGLGCLGAFLPIIIIFGIIKFIFRLIFWF